MFPALFLAPNTLLIPSRCSVNTYCMNQQLCSQLTGPIDLSTCFLAWISFPTSINSSEMAAPPLPQRQWAEWTVTKGREGSRSHSLCRRRLQGWLRERKKKAHLEGKRAVSKARSCQAGKGQLEGQTRVLGKWPKPGLGFLSPSRKAEKTRTRAGGWTTGICKNPAQKRLCSRLGLAAEHVTGRANGEAARSAVKGTEWRGASRSVRTGRGLREPVPTLGCGGRGVRAAKRSTRALPRYRSLSGTNSSLRGPELSVGRCVGGTREGGDCLELGWGSPSSQVRREQDTPSEAGLPRGILGWEPATLRLPPAKALHALFFC